MLEFAFQTAILFVNRKEIFNFKADNKNVNFTTQFCFESISNRFGATEPKERSFKGDTYNFSLNYNIDILNLEKYIMVKENIK